MTPTPRHVTGLKAPCAFCAQCELGMKIAKTERERQQWAKMLAAHKNEQYQPKQLVLIGGSNEILY